MNEIIPGILERTWPEIENKLELVKPFAKTVHIDIIDGKFANNLTFLDPAPFKKYSDTFLLELHMMVEDPIRYLQPWAAAGFKRFLGHVEKMPDPAEFIIRGHLFGEVGLAIDGPTDIGSINNIDLNDLDCLLIMMITAGESGKKFDPQQLKKIRAIRSKMEFLPIEVDGGINNQTILEAKSATVNRFVSTSHLFGAENIIEEFKKLSALVE